MMLNNQPRTDGRSRSPAEYAHALLVVLRQEFGADFLFFDAATGEAVLPAEGGAHSDAFLEREQVLSLAADGRARVLPLAEGGYRLALLLYQAQQPVLVACGVVSALARTESETAREWAMLQGWLQAVGDRLRLADQLAVRRRGEEDRTAQAPAPWEALLALDQVVRRLRIHREPEKNQERILEAAFNLLGAQTLLWIPHNPDQPVLLQGKPCLALSDCRHLATLLDKHPSFRPPGPLLCEQPEGNGWGHRFASITSVLAFQATDHGPLGWFVALNKQAGSNPQKAVTAFRRSDAALLMPFVALLEMHARGSHRYQELKDLLVGLTRSLTTALDAKDSYTFGHSERVARIAVEIGREMGLEGDELGDIYLAGLLHDVGKIGIRDSVLLKPDVLTVEEREHIKQHVTIGYTILADLRQIRNLLPGVLYHHESWDGTGYPDGLAGENIPLLARILAVADAYDAMSNARPYRAAMPCRKVEEILVQGKGVQWDRQIVEAFLRRRHTIHAIRQRGVGDSLRLAIECTLRSESRSISQEQLTVGGEGTGAGPFFEI